MYQFNLLLLFLLPLCHCQSFVADEAVFTVNSLKALHSVNEKFISISIDPAVLLAGLNLSDTSLELAKHLNPSFIRLAGPSTPFVQYEPTDDEKKNAEDSAIIVTPSMWFGINEWFTLANLTPVFGINDYETSDGGNKWDPKSATALFELSDKLNISCYWQLGYDCSSKSTDEYKSDLKTLRKVFNDEYPGQKSNWKIVGSDVSEYLANNHVESVRRTVDELQGTIDAFMWEPLSDGRSEKPFNSRVPTWTTAPKELHSVSFASAMSWAGQVGQAAKNGFDVFFRQPRLHEFFSETPAYWVSVLHKSLMGRNVLDVKPTTTTGGSSTDLNVYGHCTKHQNNFARSGAATILIVNNGTANRTAMLKFGATALMKTTEVQSYILTANDESSTECYLNGEKLTLDQFDPTTNKLKIAPKLRYARIMNYLTLNVPPKSVGFFVLPGIQLPVCQREGDVSEVIEEIHQDQKIAFGDQQSDDKTQVGARLGLKKPKTLKEIQQMMEKELESDESYYKKMKTKRKNTKANTKKADDPPANARDVRNFFIERAKLMEKQRKQVDNGRPSATQLFEMRHHPSTTAKPPNRELELELSSGEIKRILADRAKAKAAKKNILFTSEELEEIMNKATEKILKNKNTFITIRRKEKREADINKDLLRRKTLGQVRKNTKSGKRDKRDINLDMIKMKNQMMQNKNKKHEAKFENNANKEATIRQEGQTSEELFPESVEEAPAKVKSPIPDEDVFAQVASGEISTTTPALPVKKHHALWPPKANLFKPSAMPTRPKFDPKPKQHLEVQPLDLDDVSDEEELMSDENVNNFGFIHEFGPETGRNVDEKHKVSELWEGENGGAKPELANRGLEALSELEEESAEEGPMGNLKRFLKQHSMADESISGDYGDIDSSDGPPSRRKRHVSENSGHYEMKLLKNRLAFRKQLDEMNKILAHNEQTGDKMRIAYKPLSDSVKEWKVSEIPTYTRRQQQTRRSRRDVNQIDFNTIENEIDSFMNEISKDPKMVQPKLDMANGDYQLTFPNSDKIEVIEKDGGGTELKLQLHEVNNKNATAAALDEKSNIQKIPKKQVDKVWSQIFNKLSNFFRGLGNKLKKYVFDDLLK